MTTADHDTNPSTPSSKRASEPRLAVPAEPARESSPGKPARARPTTDPGVAPPADTLPVPQQPMGIVVPSIAPVADDSVDILLEGIHTERARATPRTEGEPAAAHHAEHAVHAPQVSSGDEPKVVIDGRPLGRTVQRGRVRSSGREVDARAWTETTQIRALPSTSRVIIAVVAGLAVVLAIFVALQRTSPEFAKAPAGASSTRVVATVAAPPPSATAPGSTVVAAIGTSEPIAPIPPRASPTEISLDATPAPSVGPSARKAAPAARPSKPRAKPAGSAGKQPAADLGEFKGSF